MVPSIPEGGTKSRVETQIRVVVDLADTNSLSGDPLKYDRVGSWKWLKLPLGTATKKRTRKQGKIGWWYTASYALSRLTLVKTLSQKISSIYLPLLLALPHHTIAFLAAQIVKLEKYVNPKCDDSAYVVHYRQNGSRGN
jgi:hypothetical protein